MRVRLRLHPEKYWVVESKHWYQFDWQYNQSFSGGTSYERAKDYALGLKHPQTEEIT